MKPVSSSDLDCYKNFEYHEMLKRRYRDDEDEKDEVERFCNPAFRLEVKRHNDATIFDCQCNDSELTEENANADIPASFRVRRTVTSHVIRYEYRTIALVTEVSAHHNSKSNAI